MEPYIEHPYMKLLRQELEGKGQRQLAREIGIPVQSLSNYLLNGSEPRLPTLKKMADHFGVSISELLSGKERQPTGLDLEIIKVLGTLSDSEKRSWLAAIREATGKKKD